MQATGPTPAMAEVARPSRDEGAALRASSSQPAPPDRVRPGPLARWPALPAAGLFAFGIALHESLPPAAGAALGLAAFLAFTALLIRTNTIGNALLVIAITALGLAAAQLAHFSFAADHIALYTGAEPRLAGLEVRLDEAPRLLRMPDASMPRPPKHTTIAEVTAVHTWSGWRPAAGLTLLQFDAPCPEARAGDRLRLFGMLERPGEAMNPGQFDFAAYYRGQGVLASVSVDGPHNVTTLSHHPPPLLSRFREQARRWLDAGFDARAQEQAAILRALLLGERDPVMSDAREAFRRSGTSHHLAISGMHIAIVGGLVFGFLRLVGAGPRVSLVAGVTTILVYGSLAMPSAPVIRATFLAVAFGVGLFVGRRGPGVQLLAVAAIFVLLVNPLDLYRAGFQLTFITVLGLLLFSRPAQETLDRWAGRSDADLLRLGRERALIRITHWLDGRAVGAIAAAVVAWVVASPLVAMHFEQFNPWAIPASLAAAPLVFASLVAGVLKVLLTAALPAQAWLWAECAEHPVRAMQWIVEWFAARPGADVPLPEPRPWLIGAFYLCVGAWLLRWPGALLTWTARAPAVACAVFLFVVPYAGGASPLGRSLEVTVLAVGAGQCVVIETPGGRLAMIDVGSSSLGDPVEKCVAPFLRHRGHARVDLIVISHANHDHYGGAPDVTRRYGVGEVLVASQFDADARRFATGRLTLDELASLDRPPRTVRPGDSIPLGRQTRLEVLWPPPEERALGSNDASLVLKLHHAGRTILFPGDIQEQAMRRLLALHRGDPSLLAADVLIAPHHGSSEDNTAAFVEAVNPRWIISSNGRALAQKQRRFEQMTGGRPLLRTHETGAVMIGIDDAGEMEVETFLGSQRRTLRYSE